jgi:sugar lactone lactonase YvrE
MDVLFAAMCNASPRLQVLSYVTLALAIASAACGGSQKPDATAAPANASATAPAPLSNAPPVTTTTTAVAAPATHGALEATAPSPAQPASLPSAVFLLAGFSTPESILYDEANDRYLVSNINGKPIDADNNGYISIVSPDGKMVTEKWIAGGQNSGQNGAQNKVTLNAPKGSAIAAGVLYVADIDAVRMFDAKSGAPKGEVKVPGATFLNDVAAGPDGKIYVTDSGMKPGASGFESTGTDAVYLIEKGKAKAIAKDRSLNQPNGIVVGPTGVWIASFASDELYRLDDKGKKQDVQRLPKGGLDGLVLHGDTFYVSSWPAAAVYKGKSGGTFDIAVGGVKSPADIGFDKKRSRILVPHFMENTIEVFEVK